MPKPYRIVVRGELGEKFSPQFEGMRLETGDGKTYLWGEMDQSKLHGILERIQQYNLEIIDVAEYSRTEEPPLGNVDGRESQMSSVRGPALPEGAGNWWALLLRGIFAVLFGLVALIWPGLTLFVLILAYGAYALIDGILAVVTGLGAGSGTRRTLLVIEGVVGILAGLLVLAWPDLSALFVLYIIALWAIFGGIFRVIAAISLRRELDNEWALGLSGVLSILLGLVLIVLPGVGLLSLTWLIGIFALGVGTTLIVLAVRLWKFGAGAGSRMI